MSSQLHCIKNIHSIQSVLNLLPHTIERIECGLKEELGSLIESKIYDHRIQVVRSPKSIGLQFFCRPLEVRNDEWLDSTYDSISKILILDGVTDPHNLGACIRSAAVFGVDAILISKHHTVKLTEVVRNVACGGAERVPLVMVKNISRAIERLKKIGFWVYGACESGQVKLESVNFNNQVILVMGAEGRGIKKGIRAHCDHLFSISTQKNFTCLNVSVATALCLHQIHLNQ